MSLEAIKYKNGKLEILDQLKLPFESVYINIDTIQDGWRSIHEMRVRGKICFKKKLKLFYSNHIFIEYIKARLP